MGWRGSWPSAVAPASRSTRPSGSSLPQARRGGARSRRVSARSTSTWPLHPRLARAPPRRRL
eukprot:9188751-Alexandrium_andersonii.AAC.1